jgi:hypothetical protein
VADEHNPQIPPESAQPPSIPATPEPAAEPAPLDEAPLGEFVKRRATGENQAEKPAADEAEEPADDDLINKGVPKGGKSVPKTRFDQVYRQRSDAQRERDAAIAKSAQLEAELQQFRQRQPAAETPQQPVQSDRPPILEEWLAAGKTYEDWMDAKISYQAERIADARIQATMQRSVQERADAERQQQIGGLAERTEAAKQKYPDYEEKVIHNSDVRLSPVMAEIAARSPHGPDIMYWLGTHKTDADQLGELTRHYGPAAYPLVEAHLLLLSGQVPQSTGAKKAVPISQAPAPISPVGGGSTTTTASLDQISLGDYVKRRNAIDQKKRTG